MSSRVSPASAMAARAASTVRSRSERPRRRPTSDCPMPEMIGPALQRLLAGRGLTTHPRAVGRSEEREPHVLDVLEDHAHRHADVHVVGLDVDQVGRQPHVGLLVDRHPGDDVGVAAGDPLLVVDGEGLDVAAAADLLRRQVARQAARADGPRRVDEEPAGVAAQEAQHAVGARGPEEGDVVAEARQETQHRAVGNHGGMLAHAARRPGRPDASGVRRDALRDQRGVRRRRPGRAGRRTLPRPRRR